MCKVSEKNIHWCWRYASEWTKKIQFEQTKWQLGGHFAFDPDDTLGDKVRVHYFSQS